MHVPGSYLDMMCCKKMFCKIIGQILDPGCHKTLKKFCLTWSVIQKRISMEHDCCFLTVSFAIQTAILLSQCTGVVGCVCPISCYINRNILASLTSRYNAANSAPAAEHTTSLNIPHKTCVFPLVKMFLFFFGMFSKKIYYPIILLPSFRIGYDA